MTNDNNPYDETPKYTPPVDGFYALSGYTGMWCTKDKYDNDTAKLKAENANLKWEYENVCKFATQFEEGRDRREEELKRVKLAKHMAEALGEQLYSLQARFDQIVEEMKEISKVLSGGGK